MPQGSSIYLSAVGGSWAATQLPTGNVEAKERLRVPVGKSGMEDARPVTA